MSTALPVTAPPLDETALEALCGVAPDDRVGAWQRAQELAIDAAAPRRAAAARLAGATGRAEEATELLGRLSDDVDVGVRLAATVALARTPWRGRLPLLATRLDDGDWGVAFTAAQGLCAAGDRRGEPLLVDCLQHKPLRLGALELLLELGAPALLPVAERLFSGWFSPPFEKAVAALALARRGDAAALTHVRSRIAQRRAEERPLLLVQVCRALPSDGPAMLEPIARDTADYLRESALLALTRHDHATGVEGGHWSRLQAALAERAEDEPATAAELLGGMAEIDPVRAQLLITHYLDFPGELGLAARQLRLSAHLRELCASEVMDRCD